jgi:co-chaperonin GroES (HSP10)
MNKENEMLTPVNNLIMVEQDAKETKTESGIVVGVDHSQAQTATVLALGPDAGVAVAVGDKIILDYSKAWQVKYNNKVYHFIEPKFVIAKT